MVPKAGYIEGIAFLDTASKAMGLLVGWEPYKVRVGRINEAVDVINLCTWATEVHTATTDTQRWRQSAQNT
jgi:hypothetical protein